MIRNLLKEECTVKQSVLLLKAVNFEVHKFNNKLDLFFCVMMFQTH